MTFIEKRRFERRRSLKNGRVVFNRAGSTIDCVMSNHSEGGAQLDVASILGIPNAFDLRLDGRPSRSCAVIWRRADALGVEFTAV